jgi:hypothetical protein
VAKDFRRFLIEVQKQRRHTALLRVSEWVGLVFEPTDAAWS